MKKMPLSQKIVIAIVLGAITGGLTGNTLTPYLAPFGRIFVNLLKMVVVPLVFCSITLGVAQIADIRMFGRVGTKVGLRYLTTMVLSTIIGVGCALLIRPGEGFIASTEATLNTSKNAPPSVVDVIVNMVPSNPIDSMAKMDLNSIIFFSIMLGIALILIGDKKKPVLEWLVSMNDAMIKMTEICIQFAPIGVFALMTQTAGKYGMNLVKPLAKFFLTEYLAMIILIFTVYAFFCIVLAKIPFFKYLNRVKDVALMAASTTSSAATLPLEMEVAQTRLGIPSSLAGFALPLGATINQDGAALNIPICVIFTAQAFGLPLGLGDIFTISFLAVIMSMGAAGVPASASVFVLIILSRFGLPNEAFAMILAVYTLLDMGLTVVNVVGDLVAINAVAESEGIQDRSVWDTDA
jgi:Na+/H+-dicarboxylate symporters